MDAFGSSSLALRAARSLALAFFVAAPIAAGGDQLAGPAARVKQLYQEGRWEEIVREVPASSNLPPELDYDLGMALAHLNRFEQARRAFEAGWKKDPGDERFPLELAGIAFKTKDYPEAKADLHEALRLNPKDDYAADFLATIYFLEHDLDAALEYWNRANKPEIRGVQTEPALRVDPALLDRAFAFSRASVLKLGDLQTTRARLNQLGIFPQYRFDLEPSQNANNNDTFDVSFSAVERNGWGSGRLEGLLSLLSGVPYETVYPDLYNFRRAAFNVTSLVRWDPQKRRLWLALSAPVRGDPAWRCGAYVDLRDENWDLSRTFHTAGPPLDNLKLRKAEAGAEIKSIVNGRWSWTTGMAATRRTFSNFSAAAVSSQTVFANSFSLEYHLGTDYLLLDRPENRFTLNSALSDQIGRIFTRPFNNYSKAEGLLRARWFPKAEGDDYEMEEQVRGGAASADAPFDELFMLGLERDNDLPLRAHIGTRDGKKGNAPLGRDYFLSNWEINKNVYENGWMKLRLAPFLDSGRITDGSGPFGESRWLWDTGGEAKVRILGGLTVVLTYGKNLRTGGNSFYATVVPH